MGFFDCCGKTFKTLSRAAAKSAASKLRGSRMLGVRVDWARRAEICERCPLRVVRRNVSYCGNPLLEDIDRPIHEGCGCPTVAKAKTPGEHCPLTQRYAPANAGACDCKWCVGAAAAVAA